ncbi:zinc ribbon domain-containing protein [Acidobacteria bacterium AH-259-L09]|nr:zinc ribbon domain-containing protein [Acidobacteria bacterium AH-259-L09]
MPVYEYLCQDCGRRFSRFFWRISDADGTRCRCGSSKLEQLISRISTVRSEESRLESMADPSKWGDFDENDPKSMARMMKKLGSEVGEDLGPEFNEMVDRLEAGEDPESIESSLGSNGGEADTDNLF